MLSGRSQDLVNHQTSDGVQGVLGSEHGELNPFNVPSERRNLEKKRVTQSLKTYAEVLSVIAPHSDSSSFRSLAI